MQQALGIKYLYLHNGISFTDKIKPLYLIVSLVSVGCWILATLLVLCGPTDQISMHGYDSKVGIRNTYKIALRYRILQDYNSFYDKQQF